MSGWVPEGYRSYLPEEALCELEGLGGHELSTADKKARNCFECAMVRPAGKTRDLGPFRPQLKCCTYTPFLPSFSIGELIRGGDRGASLNEYFQRVALTPLGGIPRRRHAVSLCQMGQHEKDRCPFLDHGDNPGCRIFSLRPGVCAAYVCQVGEDPDFDVWKSRERELSRIEWEFCHEIAFELGYTLDDVQTEFKSSEEAGRFFIQAHAVALVLRRGSG